MASRIAWLAPLEPTGYIAWAASPSRVTRPCDHRSIGSRSHTGYSQNTGVDWISAGRSTSSMVNRTTWGITSSKRPGRDQSSRRGGGVPSCPTFTITAQLVRRWSSSLPSPMGYRTTLAAMPPAMIIERPVRNAGQSVAPRQSIVPFQRGGGSPSTSAWRTVEWMPSAPIRASPRTVSQTAPSWSTNVAVTPSSSCSKPASRQLVRMISSPRRSITASRSTPCSTPRWMEN
jgi:hypothetical protein